MIALLIALAMLSSPTLATEESALKQGPSRSALSSASRKSSPAKVKEFDARKLGGGVLGQEVSNAEPIMFSDRFPFGAKEQTAAWLIHEEVQISNGEETQTTALSVVVDAETGGVTTVFTTPKASWVVPTMAPRSPEDEARLAHWRVTAGSVQKTALTARQVLSLIWKRYGVSPSEPGQIVMRPRRVATRYPALKQTNGESIPKYPEGVAWIVEILGHYVSGRAAEYWTGHLVLVDDQSGEIVATLFLP